MRRLVAPLLPLLLSACPGSTDTKDTRDTSVGAETGEGEGEGEDDCPQIGLSSLSVGVSNAAAGAANTATLTITNACSGEVPLIVTPSLEASSSSTFSIPTDRVTVPPNTEQTLVVTFTPPDFQAYAGTLVLDSNDPHNPNIEVPIWGQAVADADADGFDSVAAGGEDCDDSDEDVYPGAEDDWYDGIDGDCAGDDDYDQDKDGYGSEDHGGEDCDDTDETVYPGAEDDWYDGIDGDCAGNSDYDQDGDGQDAESWRGPDCDDDDPDIYFGADETPYDGVDSDCREDSDYDADGDGHDSPDYGGDDCDDEDPDSSPTAADVWDGEDDDCDGLLDEDGVGVGYLLVTEMMTDTVKGTEAYAEWFEVYNDSAMDIDVYGWEVSDEDGEGFTIDLHLTIGPGEHVVFGVSADMTKNGGISPDYLYSRSTFNLQDRNDDIILSVEGREIAVVSYTSSYGLAAGYAAGLDPDRYDDTFLDDADAWCAASSTFGTGDYGTPGALNDDC